MATFLVFGGPGAMIATLAKDNAVREAMGHGTSLGTWLVVTVISGFAIIMLPRQFYVMIVENRGEAELRRPAGSSRSIWSQSTSSCCRSPLPADMVGSRTGEDLYVLSLPLLLGQDWLAMVAFIGGSRQRPPW